MTKKLPFALAFLAITGAQAFAETAPEFAGRLQGHFSAVAADPRVRLVALNASPSDVVVEFGLTAEGKARDARIVHAILSNGDRQLVLEALNALPPFPLNGYAEYNSTYRLPIRLNLVPEPAAN